MNTGNVEDLLPRVQARAEAIRDRSGRPVHLVGWSLGGVLARELARDTPALAGPGDLIRHSRCGRACIDDDTPGARNIEVRSTHLGMGIDPDVWQILAETLPDATVDR